MGSIITQSEGGFLVDKEALAMAVKEEADLDGFCHLQSWGSTPQPSNEFSLMF